VPTKAAPPLVCMLVRSAADRANLDWAGAMWTRLPASLEVEEVAVVVDGGRMSVAQGRKVVLIEL